jgi:hypothetical protein
MPDTKITALAAITTVAPANDLFAIVDVSDNSMAASGTTKNITTNQILGAGGTATLASATITGDLTVRTTGLTTTTTGVGIGTASPILPLDVRGTAGAGALFLRTTDPTAPVASAYIQTPVSTGFSSTVPMYGFWYQNCGMGNPASENLSWIINSSEAMRLNSTGLGVGVTPSEKLDINGNARVQLAYFTGGTIPGLANSNPWAYRIPGGGLGLGAATETGTTSPIIMYTGQGGVERVRVKGAGQVRFFPLAADPAGAEAGDVYYNSTSNKLKCYNGTTWNDLF